MKKIDIQLLMLEYIKQHPDVTETELLENIKITIGSPDDQQVNSSLVEGLFYGGLITVKLTPDNKDRVFRARHETQA